MPDKFSLEYRDLLAFLAVARCGSYSAAALQLNLAQSALSRRILRLEADLGVSLFERHARGVSVTPAGQSLLPRIEKLDLELRQIEQEMRGFGLAAAEDVRIAMPQGAARLLTSPMVAAFRTLHPHTRLQIFERDSMHNQDAVRRGEVDLALAYAARPHAELELTPLLFERIFVIAPQAGDWPESFSLAELARLKLILPGLPHGYRRVIETAMQGEGLAPNIILEVNGFATSLEMVQQGLGCTISTYPPVQAQIEAGGLRCIRIRSPVCEVMLSLVQRRDSAMPPVVRSLKSVIEAVAGELSPGPHWRRAER